MEEQHKRAGGAVAAILLILFFVPQLLGRYTYDSDFESAFMTGCASKGQTVGTCRCDLSWLEKSEPESQVESDINATGDVGEKAHIIGDLCSVFGIFY